MIIPDYKQTLFITLPNNTSSKSDSEPERYSFSAFLGQLFYRSEEKEQNFPRLKTSTQRMLKPLFTV